MSLTSSVTIVPGLVVTADQFELATAGLANHAPEMTLTWEQWTAPARWGLVPDEQTMHPYKAEFTLQDRPGPLRRINIWFEPDLRGDNAPRPHSHPWPFQAHVLAGGYTETRFAVTGGAVDLTVAEHETGATNPLPRDLFHEVTGLHTEPGGTLTLMTATGPGVRGGWGYLDPNTGEYEPAPAPSSEFQRAWHLLNPHLR